MSVLIEELLLCPDLGLNRAIEIISLRSLLKLLLRSLLKLLLRSLLKLLLRSWLKLRSLLKLLLSCKAVLLRFSAIS